jgi:hypothetical protein
MCKTGRARWTRADDVLSIITLASAGMPLEKLLGWDMQFRQRDGIQRLTQRWASEEPLGNNGQLLRTN